MACSRRSAAWTAARLRAKRRLAGKAKTLSNLAAEEGVMILIAGANVVRFAPALNVSEEEVNSGLDRVERACARFVAGVSS